MSKGIIYLIQPSELIGTNRYKIGCSNSPTLTRCINGYKTGSRYISINECINPFVLEKKIINEFNKLFKLIAGHEIFEGDENLMCAIFMKIITEYKTKHNNFEIKCIKLNKNNIYCKKYKCVKCNKEFAHFQSRWRHEKTCKINEMNIINEIKEIKTKITQLETKPSIINYNTNTTNNIQNIIIATPSSLENINNINPQQENFNTNSNCNNILKINSYCITTQNNNISMIDTKLNSIIKTGKDEIVMSNNFIISNNIDSTEYHYDSSDIESDDEVNSKKLAAFRKMFPVENIASSDSESDDEVCEIIIKNITYILENNNIYTKLLNGSKGLLYGTYSNGKIKKIKK
jgi:hypothetical protein